MAPTKFTYERWRHGGWYVHNIRYPNGGCGCVSNNYADKKWRIACDPAPFEKQTTFRTRDEAALAEWFRVEDLWRAIDARPLVAALERAQRLFKEALPKFDWGKSALDANAIQLLNEVPGQVRAALAKARGEKA